MPTVPVRATKVQWRSEGPNKGVVISNEETVFGPVLVLNGDFTGRGNFIIQGRVEADVALEARDVTVARSGSVRADIHGARIYVEGEVHGNLVGLESVVIRPSGRVRGDVTAPTVNLERGGRLLGSIDTSR